MLACFIAATVVMQMTAERDGPLLRPMTDVFDPEDRPLLEVTSRDLEGATERQKNPYPYGRFAFAFWVCARLGGWTGILRQARPHRILRGWTEFQPLKHGAALGHAVIQRGDQDV